MIDFIWTSIHVTVTGPWSCCINSVHENQVLMVFDVQQYDSKPVGAHAWRSRVFCVDGRGRQTSIISEGFHVKCPEVSDIIQNRRILVAIGLVRRMETLNILGTRVIRATFSPTSPGQTSQACRKSRAGLSEVEGS
jgi:hypothetical protein